MACFDSPSIDSGDELLQKEYASISRQQYGDWVKRFEPELTELISTATDDNFISGQVDKASAGVNDQFDTARSNIGMTNERYGVRLTPRQQAAQDKQLQLSQLSTESDTRNRTRVRAADTQDALRSSIIGIGNGIRSESLGNYSSVAGMEGRRNQMNLQAQSNSQSGMMNLVGQGIGTASSLFMLSDRDKKTDITDADTKSHLNEMKTMKLSNYKYEAGIDSAKKTRTGTMWQDNPTLQAATDERVLDLGDWNAKNTGAIQELDREISRGNKAIRAMNKEIRSLKLQLKRAA